MKALSLHQPWASLVILGAKRFETRSWQTEYRGPLAIHATARMSKTASSLCWQEPFCTALGIVEDSLVSEAWPRPLGAVLGVVELVECVETQLIRDGISDFKAGERARPPISPEEFAFGDYRPGRWAWRLGLLQRFERPVPLAGRLGLWECDERLLPEWKPAKKFKWICEGCAVDDADNDSVQLRDSGRVLCERCFDREEG